MFKNFILKHHLDNNYVSFPCPKGEYLKIVPKDCKEGKSYLLYCHRCHRLHKVEIPIETHKTLKRILRKFL